MQAKIFILCGAGIKYPVVVTKREQNERMMVEETGKRAIPATKGDEARGSRLKSALRENLKRRKAAPRTEKPVDSQPVEEE